MAILRRTTDGHVLFPTIDFAIFFAVVYTVQWFLNPHPGPWKLFMIAASYFFYAWWDWRFTFLLATSTVIAQVGGSVVHRASGRKRKAALWSTLALLVGLLAWFKYYGFLAVNVDNAMHFVDGGRPLPLLTITLPVAISFFTFMAISYVFDIYRGVLTPARAIDTAVYLSFFPHLVAGPIVRGTELLPQIRRRRDEDHVDYVEACWLILAGLFKKVVLSSYLATYVVDPGVRGSQAALGPRSPPRHLRVRRPDLRRLQRLHRHRHRSRPAHGNPVPPELQAALYRHLVAGLLATLAHHPVVLAS